MDSEVRAPPSMRIARRLGSGGMGVVYEAWDNQLERRVALKVLHPHLTANEEMKNRLLVEARHAARIEHPGVVRVYRIHEINGALQLETEFVDGTPFDQILRHRPISPMQAADLLSQILGALSACHANNVVHGDLKPNNLLVKPDGHIMLTDFGISHAIHANDDSIPMGTSRSSPMWCTPQYCPPEAWDGGLPTPVWDLYALGILVHEALAGKLPFEDRTPATMMRAKLEFQRVPVREARPDLSEELASLIDSLDDPDPAKRPASADEALDRLCTVPEYRSHSSDTQPMVHSVPANMDMEGMNEIDRAPDHASSRRIPINLSGLVKVHVSWLSALFIAGISFVAFQRENRQATVPEIELTQSGAGSQEILGLYLAGDMAYFSHDDGIRGRELWGVDRTGTVEIIADIDPGPRSSNPGNFFSRPSGGVLFSARTSDHGVEPWFCGRNAVHDTWMVRDIIPGPMSSEPLPVAAWENTFMFYATTLSTGRELWCTNTIEAQTGILGDVAPGSLGTPSHGVSSVADSKGAYFSTVSDNGQDYHLYRYDHEHGAIRDLGYIHAHPTSMVLFKEYVFLVVQVADYGNELWRYSPNQDSIELFLDIFPGTESSNPGEFTVWNERMYFQANGGHNGAELWVTDGTVEGTIELSDIAHGEYSGSPYGFLPVTDHMYFRADDPSYGEELWVTDGTRDGTRLVFDLRAGSEGSHPYNLATNSKQLFFTADDGARGEELWVVDPSNIDSPPVLVEDIWLGREGSEPHDLSWFDETTGVFICKSSEGTKLKKIQVTGNQIDIKTCEGLVFWDQGQQ